jgi:hypothetical protein
MGNDEEQVEVVGGLLEVDEDLLGELEILLVCDDVVEVAANPSSCQEVSAVSERQWSFHSVLGDPWSFHDGGAAASNAPEAFSAPQLQLTHKPRQKLR